jgi:pyruvate/2-oxoglutarate dehydrogenase complex dihydrolipoamide dehydrogenase (E3) component
MSDSQRYDALVVGGGKGVKTLAMYLGKQNYKVAMIERDPMMIGGGCINVACIPTKTFIASARLVHSIRRAAEYVGWERTASRSLVAGIPAIKNACTVPVISPATVI